MKVFFVQRPGKRYIIGLLMNVPGSYYFMLGSVLLYYPSPVFFICFYIRSQENGPTTDYGNHRFHNYAAITQTRSQQLHVWIRCVCVCNLFSCPHQSNFDGEALSSLDLGTGAYADTSPSYLTTYLFQGHIRRTRSEPHCSARLCTTPVFSIHCGDGVQAGCVCRCPCMDLHFLETALI